MEGSVKDLIYLTKQEICLINKEFVIDYGGFFLPEENIINEDSLNYLVEAVQFVIFGVEIYPTLSMKAAIYLHTIIRDHIFNDGNKRTGLQSSLLFLEKNNFVLKYNVTEHELIDLPLRVANGERDVNSIAHWFETKTIHLF